MIESILLVGIVAFLLGTALFMKKTYYRYPGPWCNALPVVGYLPFIGKAPYRTLHEISKKYGSVVQLKLGIQNYVILSTDEVLREGLKKKGESLWGKPQSFMAKKTCGASHAEHGENWKRRRRQITVNALRKFQTQASFTLEDIIDEEAQRLVEGFAKRLARPFEPMNGITLAVARTLFRICFGQGQNIETTQDMRDLAEQIQHYSSNTGSFAKLDLLPWLRFFDDSDLKRFVDVNTIMKGIATKGIKQRLESYSNGATVADCSDLMDAHVMAAKSYVESEGNVNEYLTDLSFYTGVIDFIRAGTETPSTALHWYVLYMITHPEVQDCLYKEIIEKFPGDTRIMYSDRKKLPYVEATMWEMFRHGSLTPVGKRAASKTVEINGHTIPEGSYVLLNYFGITRDENLWPNAEKFDPTRFLSTDGTFRRDLTEKFFPFGLGPRRCLGENMGSHVTFMCMTKMAKFIRFKKTVPNPDIVPVPGLTLTTKPYQVQVIRR